MSEENKGLDTLVQETISADVDFQAELEALPEDDRAEATATKEAEVREATFASLSEKAKKSETDYQSQKVRAEKAEKGTAKKPKEEKVETPKNEPLNLLDVRALSKVHDDDVEKVQKFAETQGLSIVDAMKDEDLQAIVKNREEKRRTAEATNIGGGNKGFKTNQDKELLKKIDKGDQEDMSDSDLERGAKLAVEALKTQR